MLIESDNTPTPAEPQPMVIAALSFKSEVLDSKLPVLVAFWTGWSRPCQILDAVLVELAREWAGKIKMVKVDADDSLDLSLWYEIAAIPTLIFFIDGKPLVRIVGTASKDAISEKLKMYFR